MAFIDIQKLLVDFIAHLDQHIALLENGAPATINIPADIDLKQIIRIFLKRFRYTLVDLCSEKDPLVSALLQRYNHEMLLDFYFLAHANPKELANKIHRFATYSEKSSFQKWGGYHTSDKKNHIPPWIGNNESFTKIYKRLSNLSHPNILSVSLGILDNDNERSGRVITGASALCIFEITVCLDSKIFRDMLEKHSKDLYFANLEFQKMAAKIILEKRMSSNKGF